MIYDDERPITPRTAEELERERASLMRWLERRLAWGCMSIPYSVAAFRHMWREEFGNEDDIPQELKARTMEIYRKGREEANKYE